MFKDCIGNIVYWFTTGRKRAKSPPLAPTERHFDWVNIEPIEEVVGNPETVHPGTRFMT
jgi:hypothetical protein